MTVWIVFFMDYGGEFKVKRVFSTEEAAEACVNSSKEDAGLLHSEEWQVW